MSICMDRRVRIIFFAGKGGVGKTTVSSATGIKSASLGYRTIIISLDIAHSLSDIFDLEKGLLDQNRGKPFQVEENLWIQEIDISEEIERNWGQIHRYLTRLLNTTGLDEVLAEEFAILPGMEEVSLLLYINKYVKESLFDVIILDCAPTGESIRFISIPTTLEWYMKKIFKMERAIARYAGGVLKRLYDVPIPDQEYFDSIERLFNRLKGINEILLNRTITSVRLITNPEKVVIKETQRALMYFYLYHMNIDCIIINKIIPDISLSNTEFFKDWLRVQDGYIKRVQEFFNPIPIFYLDLMKSEALGYDRLRELADRLYGDRDPLEHFYRGDPYSLKKEDHCYILRLTLPFVEKEDIELNRIEDELVVRIGAFKRHIPLPRQVFSAKDITAKWREDHLEIRFLEG